MLKDLKNTVELSELHKETLIEHKYKDSILHVWKLLKFNASQFKP